MNTHKEEVLPIPGVPDEFLEPINSLLGTARIYERILMLAIGGKPLPALIEENMELLNVAGIVMEAWNARLPEEEG